MVYRTPGGGAGEEARRLLSAADRQPQTETPSDTNASTMLGPDRMYRRKSPAAEPPRHPGRGAPTRDAEGKAAPVSLGPNPFAAFGALLEEEAEEGQE